MSHSQQLPAPMALTLPSFQPSSGGPLPGTATAVGSSPAHLSIQSPGFNVPAGLQQQPLAQPVAAAATGAAVVQQQTGSWQSVSSIPPVQAQAGYVPVVPVAASEQRSSLPSLTVVKSQGEQQDTNQAQPSRPTPQTNLNPQRGFYIRDLLGSPVDNPQAQLSHSVPPTPPGVAPRDSFLQATPSTHQPAKPLQSPMNPTPSPRGVKVEGQEQPVGQPPPLHSLRTSVKQPGMLAQPTSLMSPVDMPSPQQPVPSTILRSPMQAPGQFIPPQFYQYQDRPMGVANPREQPVHLNPAGHPAALAASVQRPSDISPMFMPPVQLGANRPVPSSVMPNLPGHFTMHHLTSPSSATAGVIGSPYQPGIAPAAGQAAPANVAQQAASASTPAGPAALVLSPGSTHPMTLNLAVNPYSQQSVRYNPDLLRSDRHMFNKHQRAELEKEFTQSKYITKTERNRLANVLALKRKQVTTWFQNRRARERRRCRRQGTSPKWDPNNPHSTQTGGELDDDTPTESQLVAGSDTYPVMLTLNRDGSDGNVTLEQDLPDMQGGDFHSDHEEEDSSDSSSCEGGQIVESTQPSTFPVISTTDMASTFGADEVNVTG